MIQRVGESVAAKDQPGWMVSGFVQECRHNAETVTRHAHEYLTMADAAEEVARLLITMRHELDEIDRQANDEIHQALSSGARSLSAATKAIIVDDVVSRARTRATEVSTVTARAISWQTAKITGEQEDRGNTAFMDGQPESEETAPSAG
ncbi:hypothetical protein [uncultured Mycobacterium sp.]|uniref:hypothetical protein n=1 Tax=uncultured Mycobacterium sp. TaxID=171292 RepID=UPI0035CC9F20